MTKAASNKDVISKAGKVSTGCKAAEVFESDASDTALEISGHTANRNENDGLFMLEQQIGGFPSEAAIVPVSENVRRETAEEKWEKAGIGNAFIFGKVMSENPDHLLELLQLALPELEIMELVDPCPEVSIKPSYDAHGVRLDIKAQDVQGRIFNIEMELWDEQHIRRRIRYYSSTLDSTILKPGEDYSRLGNTVVLFITTFDPFKKNRIRYTFRNICVEDRTLELEDGTTRMILNASGCLPEIKKGSKKPAHSAEEEKKEEKISEELRGFLALVMGEKPPKGIDTFAGRVQQSVDIAKRSSTTRREYMNWEMTLTVERNKGRDEGEILKVIKMVMKKSSRGQSADKIAEDLMEDVGLVNAICNASFRNNSAEPEEILTIIRKEPNGYAENGSV